MKRKLSLVTKISSLIFIVLMCLALAFAHPVYSRLKKNIDLIFDQVLVKVSEKTGLYITYDAVSPSILTSFYIHGVKLSDSDGNQIIKIEKTKVSYHISELIKGNASSFVRSISIDGVEVDIIEITDHVKQLIEQLGLQNMPDFEIEQITDLIPSNLSVKNVYITYDDNDLDLEVFLKQIEALNSRRRKNIEISSDCKARVVLKQQHIPLSTNAKLNGTLYYGLENSFVNISFADLTQGSLKLNKLNFVTTYADKSIDLQLVKNTYPLYLKGSYNFEKKEVAASVKSQQLVPADLLNTQKNKQLAKILKAPKLTINCEADYNLSTSKLNYKSDGNVSVAKTLIPGGADIDYALNGNLDKINLSSFRINGQNYDANAQLSLLFKNLKADGFIDVAKCILPNGTPVSAELYVDPLDAGGFMLFVPQVMLGEKSLTALQGKLMPLRDSYDFELEAYDYSRAEEAGPGCIEMSGSYLKSSNYIQTGVSMNSIYIQSVLEFVTQFLDEKNKQLIAKAENFAKPYMFSGDAYLSTDFKSVLYNVPYIVLANTQVDNQVVFVALNGNEQTIQLNRFDLIYNKLAVNAQASLERSPESKDMFFTFDAISGSIPYHLTGTIMPEMVTVTGDYNTNVEVRLNEGRKNNKKISGTALFENLPFGVGTKNFISSADIAFDYSQLDGPQVQLNRFELETTNALSSVGSRLVMTGTGTKYGAQLNSISYTDLYSNLEGTADVLINFDSSILQSAEVKVALSDPLSEESIVLDASVSNPELQAFSTDALLKSFYVNALADFNHFSLNRFMNVKNSNNELTASLSLAGTLEHPYAVVNLQNFAFLFANDIIKANGILLLEDKDLSINEFNIAFTNFKLHDITANASLSTLTGELNAVFETVGPKNLIVPMKFSVLDTYIPPDSKLPENMMINVNSSGIGGTLMKQKIPFDINLFYTPGMVSFYSSGNLGLNGTYDFKNGLEASVHCGNNFSGEVTGEMNKQGINFLFENFEANIPNVLSFMNMEDLIIVNSGIAKGNLVMSGTMDNPEFFGSISMENPVFKLPMFLDQTAKAQFIEIKANNNEFTIDPTDVYLKNTPYFKTGANVTLNKWVIDQFIVTLNSLPSRQIPLSLKLPMMKIEGDVNCNLNLAFENRIWNLSGDARFDNTSVNSSVQELSNVAMEGQKAPFGFTADVKVMLGNHSKLTLDPLLRCIFVPNTLVAVKMDSENNYYEFNGQVQLKSGDITYLNRNFYIKEGNIKFNPSDVANPLITLRAETREKDENGKNLRIVLAAENQYLQNFEPHYYSVPPKSENEIRSLLGQIVIADSDSVTDLVASAGDFALQSMVVRGVENKLRDLLKFDIFSIRTNILQNTMSLSNQLNANNNNQITLGNFLDNSTVYIGKYLGSSLYVDAMLNLSLEDKNAVNVTDAGGVLLQPEIGFEFEIPFLKDMKWDSIQDMSANVRMGLAWDAEVYSAANGGLNSNWHFKPSVDFSLSWRL